MGEINPSGETDVTFTKPGLYGIGIIGGLYAKNNGSFRVSIRNNSQRVNVSEPFMKFNFFHKGKKATELYQFTIDAPGKYLVATENIRDLEVKESRLVSKRMFQTKKDSGEIGIIVKESSSIINFILGLLMVVLGINGTVWSFILAFNPNLV